MVLFHSIINHIKMIFYFRTFVEFVGPCFLVSFHMVEHALILRESLNRKIITVKSLQDIKRRILIKSRILLTGKITLDRIVNHSEKAHSLASIHWYSEGNSLLIFIVRRINWYTMLARRCDLYWNLFFIIHTDLIQGVFRWT